jgi:hypothetical protein
VAPFTAVVPAEIGRESFSGIRAARVKSFGAVEDETITLGPRFDQPPRQRAWIGLDPERFVERHACVRAFEIKIQARGHLLAVVAELAHATAIRNSAEQRNSIESVIVHRGSLLRRDPLALATHGQRNLKT